MNGNNITHNRDYDVLTHELILEDLVSFKNFPVFMGCVDSPKSEDIFHDMNWVISPRTGIVQINPVVDEKLVYMKSHWSGMTGNTWKNHHVQFSDFVRKHLGKNALEIGSSHGMLYELLGEREEKYTIVEPNYIGKEFENVKIIKSFFDSSFDVNEKFDTIIHSHLFEHIMNYDDFFEGVKRNIQKNGVMIFSIPNMDVMLNDSNQFCLCFEHTVLLRDEYVQFFMNKHGFEIVDRFMFNKHSTFYCVVYNEKYFKQEDLSRLYEENKNIILSNYKSRHEDVKNINRKIAEHKGEVYLYSGHYFSQFLLNIGLDTNKIVCILDNDINKIGKRLYGTDFIVRHPKTISENINPAVILRAGIYNEEIRNQLLSLNDKTTIL